MRHRLFRASRPFLLLAALTALPLDASGVATAPSGFSQEILADGLDVPNSFAFLPDGRILFTEQMTGHIRLVVSGINVVPTPVCTVEGVSSNTIDRGLQGIAVDPRWPAFPYVYVIFNHVGEQEWIVRYNATGSLTDPLASDLSLGDPLILIDNIRDIVPIHNGGTLRFGPDGYLYATIGDDASACASQSPDSLLGKLLRLDVSRLPAGPGGPVPRGLLIPPDNPISGADSNAYLVYAMGLRNPWRMHIDPLTGSVYVADVGLDTEEEVDEIVPGGNYGWPYREGSGPSTYPYGCTSPPGAVYEEPILSLNHELHNFLAIQTATVYRPVPGGTANWPEEYWGNLFVGDYYESRLRRMVKTGGTWSLADPVSGQPSPDDWAGGMFWAVDFLVGPDGSLYWLKAWDDAYRPFGGTIRRIRWVGTGAGVSSRSASGALTSAPNPFARHVELSGAFPSGAEVRAAVYDPMGRRVRTARATEREPGRYAWTWDGRDDDGTAARAGIYLVRFRSGRVEQTTRVLRVK